VLEHVFWQTTPSNIFSEWVVLCYCPENMVMQLGNNFPTNGIRTENIKSGFTPGLWYLTTRVIATHMVY
jgi:hypothetical protein